MQCCPTLGWSSSRRFSAHGIVLLSSWSGCEQRWKICEFPEGFAQNPHPNSWFSIGFMEPRTMVIYWKHMPINMWHVHWCAHAYPNSHVVISIAAHLFIYVRTSGIHFVVDICCPFSCAQRDEGSERGHSWGEMREMGEVTWFQGVNNVQKTIVPVRGTCIWYWRQDLP